LAGRRRLAQLGQLAPQVGTQVVRPLVLGDGADQVLKAGDLLFGGLGGAEPLFGCEVFRWKIGRHCCLPLSLCAARTTGQAGASRTGLTRIISEARPHPCRARRGQGRMGYSVSVTLRMLRGASTS